MRLALMRVLARRSDGFNGCLSVSNQPIGN